MRKNETYVAISKWTRLILLGLMPFAVILHFNLRVYLKLRQNKLNRKRANSLATFEVRGHSIHKPCGHGRAGGGGLQNVHITT